MISHLIVMYFKYFRIFPDFVRNKSFWIVTAIAVILGIWVIYLNKRTVTIEIDFGGMKWFLHLMQHLFICPFWFPEGQIKECREEKGWFTTNQICVEEEIKRKITISGTPSDVAYFKSLPLISGVEQMSYNTGQNKKRIT